MTRATIYQYKAENDDGVDIQLFTSVIELQLTDALIDI